MTNNNQPSRSKEILLELQSIRRRLIGARNAAPIDHQNDRRRANELIHELHELNPQLAWSFVFTEGTVSTWKRR